MEHFRLVRAVIFKCLVLNISTVELTANRNLQTPCSPLEWYGLDSIVLWLIKTHKSNY